MDLRARLAWAVRAVGGRSVFRARRRRRRRARRRAAVPVRPGVPRAHFLHIGKTGGSAMRATLRPLVESGRYSLVLHLHLFTLANLPEDEFFFFALRDPISRFVSGFESRRRQGRPRYFKPWSKKERAIFKRFATANALAMALSSTDDDERESAEAAMGTLLHAGTVWTWFGDEEAFAQREPFLLKVLFTDRLDDDFADLTEKLGLGSFHPVLPHDDVGSHRAPSHAPLLEDAAVEALRHWYRRDYDFWHLCRDLEARRAEGSGPVPGPSSAPRTPGSPTP